jgi:manganese-transporting P-type ATPase
VFCALLWLLDEYWSYTAFTLCSVVMYEATTVFQRTRTQKMLGGMAPTASPVYVYRCSAWKVVTTKDLLPGDIISLSFKKRSAGVAKQQQAKAKAIAAAPAGGAVAKAGKPDPSAAAAGAEEEDKGPATPLTSRDEIVHCDCVLIRGKAVVNEASLTGESVPQMKEALTLSSALAPGDNTSNTDENSTTATTTPEQQQQQQQQQQQSTLDMNGINRVNVLFSGCSFVTVDGLVGESTSSPCQIPNAPDGGALAYVLRTGFGSSQGSLLQMIEFSQQTVAGTYSLSLSLSFCIYTVCVLHSLYFE